MRLLLLRTVLVATDLESSSHDALDTAHRLAGLAGASLHVVHVVRSSPEGDERMAARSKATDDLRAVLRRMDIPDDGAKLHVIPGSPAEAIRDLAARITADVVVIGPHRQRLGASGDDTLGSTARSITERAYAPCLIVGRPLQLPLERVLVPTDFSDTARGALLVGLSWASGLRTHAAADGATTLTALHVQSDHPAAGGVDQQASLDHELGLLKQDAGSWAGVSVHGRTEHGADAARTIEQSAVRHDADIVVIGTRGRGANNDSRLGSVSESVAIRNRVPTLLVPPAVWRAHASVR